MWGARFRRLGLLVSLPKPGNAGGQSVSWPTVRALSVAWPGRCSSHCLYFFCIGRVFQLFSQCKVILTANRHQFVHYFNCSNDVWHRGVEAVRQWATERRCRGHFISVCQNYRAIPTTNRSAAQTWRQHSAGSRSVTWFKMSAVGFLIRF